MTILRKLTFFILILLLMVIIEIIMENYIFSIVIMSLIGIFAYIWYILLNEELIVYQLIKNGYKMEFTKLIDNFGKKINKTIENLKIKKIVKQKEGYIILIKSDYKLSFTKWRPRKGREKET